jgi:hypothetical protein
MLHAIGGVAAFAVSSAAFAFETRPATVPAPPPIGTVTTSPEVFIAERAADPMSQVDRATGDLNGDGLSDWAGVVYWSVDSRRVGQLFVLLQQADGRYVLAEYSQATDMDMTVDLEIQPTGTLDVGWYYHSSNATLHFKLYKGAWTRVGEDDFGYDTDTQIARRSSYNFLTGRMVRDVMGSNNKVVSSTVEHEKAEVLRLHDVGVFGQPNYRP